jgi:hypothetical protein
MSLPGKPSKPSQKSGPPQPARKREEEELARKRKKEEEEEDEELDEEEEDDDEDEEEDEEDEEEDEEEEDIDEEDLDEEDLDEEDLEDEDLDDEDLDDEDLDDEDLDDEDLDDDEDEDEDDDDDEDDEDEDEDEDEEEDEEDEKPKRKKKGSRGEGSGKVVAAAGAAAAAGVAAVALSKKPGAGTSSAKMTRVDKDEGDPSSTKASMRPVTKKASGPGQSSRIPGSSSATSRRQAGAPPEKKKDTAKSIALIACALLFLACVGVAVYVLFIKEKKVVTTKLPPEIQAIWDGVEKADELYERAKEKKVSEKLIDLQDAKKWMDEASDKWNAATELNKDFEYKGIKWEERRRHANDMVSQVTPEIQALNKKVAELEADERVRRAKENAQKKAAEKKSEPNAYNPVIETKDGVEVLDETIYKNLEEKDPSEYERFSKMLKNGKAVLKKKDGDAAPKNDAPAEPKADAPAEPKADAPKADAPAEPKPETPKADPKTDSGKIPDKAPTAPAE